MINRMRFTSLELSKPQRYKYSFPYDNIFYISAGYSAAIQGLDFNDVG